MDARRARLAAASQREDPVAPLWEPQPSEHLTTSEVLNRAPVRHLPNAIEAALLELLMQPVARDETYHRAYALRERAIRDHFSALDPGQAYEVARRLDVKRAGDQLVVAFRRLSIERQLRLRAFLESVKIKARGAGTR